MPGARGLSSSKAYPWQSFADDRSEVHAELDVRQYCRLSLQRFYILTCELSTVDIIHNIHYYRAFSADVAAQNRSL